MALFEVWAQVLHPRHTSYSPLLPQTQRRNGPRLVDMGDGTQPCPKTTTLAFHTMDCSNH